MFLNDSSNGILFEKPIYYDTVKTANMIIVAVIILIMVLVIYNTSSKQRKITTLKERYDQLLQGSNKRAALEAGRAYYGALRGGKTLTVYDEQAITNDLSAMGDAKASPDSHIYNHDIVDFPVLREDK